MLIEEWQVRKALRKEDRGAFDRLMAKARMHSDAAGYDIRTATMESLHVNLTGARDRDWRIKKENRGIRDIY